MISRDAVPGPLEAARLLRATVAQIRSADERSTADARELQQRLAKPPGSLGRLEDVAVQLAGLAGECPPPLPAPAALAVFAADHGVHARGVTPWPQAVTGQMVETFLRGGAAVNAFARQAGARIVVVDVGIVEPPKPLEPPDGQGEGAWDAGPRLLRRRVRAGTADLAAGPAMSRDDALQALAVGIALAQQLIDDGHRCLLTGDMGIANTTASAALIAAFTGTEPAEVTGLGTGIDADTWRRKVGVVQDALVLHRPDPSDPIGVLAALAGLEHAALAGFMLGGAAGRVPVVLDGVIAGAAALSAAALAPDAVGAWIAGHRSSEPGHLVTLRHLGLLPLIELDLRLGEGTGATLALPLVQAAVRAMREMATLDAAGVATLDGAGVATLDGAGVAHMDGQRQ